MRLSDAMARLEGKLPGDVMSLVHLSSDEGEAKKEMDKKDSQGLT